MPFHWNEKYEVNIPEIDSQHKALLELLNRTNEAHSNSDRNVIVSEASKMKLYMKILKVRGYALTHFITEERYMIKYKYPKFF